MTTQGLAKAEEDRRARSVVAAVLEVWSLNERLRRRRWAIRRRVVRKV